jgi:hypothetical protein
MAKKENQGAFVTKSISAGSTPEKVNEKTGAVTKAKSWPAGELKFNVDFSGYTREELELICRNAVSHHMQYGVSTLWRNNGGKLEAKAYGEFTANENAEVSFTKGFVKGQGSSVRANKIAALVAEIEAEQGRKLTEFEIGLLTKKL